MEQAKVSSSFSQSAQSADEDAAAAADHRVVQLVEPSPSLSLAVIISGRCLPKNKEEGRKTTAADTTIWKGGNHRQSNGHLRCRCSLMPQRLSL